MHEDERREHLSHHAEVEVGGASRRAGTGIRPSCRRPGKQERLAGRFVCHTRLVWRRWEPDVHHLFRSVPN
jgi:hypothetical protein